MFLFALLIDHVHSIIQLSYNEKFVYDWLHKQSFDDKIKDSAARLIQTVWRHYRWRKMKNDVFASYAMSDNEMKKASKKERKAYNANLIKCMKVFQQARRRR